MKRALALGTALGILWMTPAVAKRDGDDPRERKPKQSCLLVVGRERGAIRVGCEEP